MTRDPQACQLELIHLGYLPALNADGERNDDGVFGEHSLDAFNHFLASKGKPPVQHPTLAEINQALWPESPSMATPTSVVVDTQSAWLSTKNWAAIVGILSVILPLVGVHLPVGWGDTAYELIAALSGAYILIKNTWFTSKITTASAKNM